MALRTPVHKFSLAQKRVGVTSKRRQCSCRTCQTEDGPGPLHLGTGKTADLNWREEARGLAGSVPINTAGYGSILGAQHAGSAQHSSRKADLNEAAAAANACACS